MKHLNIWQDWLSTFSDAEQTFLKLVANEVWQKGENELFLDDLLKHERLKSYLTSDIINAPYNRLKSKGWLSRYVKDLNGYVGFTVEGSLLYLLALQLQDQKPVIDLATLQSLLKTGSKQQKSAVESFLCEQALNGDLNLVADLIDVGNEYIDISIKPLLLFLKTFGVKACLEKVLENPSENDWKALKKLDDQLADLQIHILRKEFLIEVMPQNEFKTRHALSLGLNAIAIFDKEDAIIYLNKIDTKASFILEDAVLLSQLGKCESKFGNYDKALKYYQMGLAIELKALGGEHPSVAISYGNIGGTWNSKGEYDKGLKYYQMCLAILLKTLGVEHPDVARSYSNIGSNWFSKGEYDKALEFFEKCLAIELKTLGVEHPSVATSYSNIGIMWDRKGNYNKALVYHENSLLIRLKTLGVEHPDVARSYNNIGSNWFSKGEYDKALEFFEKCLKIELKTLGGNHHSVAISYNNIGSIWCNKDENDKALEFFEKSLVIYIKTFGEKHPEVAISYNNIGNALHNKGDYDKAEFYYEKCLSIQLKTLGGKHPSVATSYSNIGSTSKKKGEYEKALEFFEKCAVIELKTLGGEYPDVATLYFEIGECNRELTRYSLAIDFFKKGFNTLKKGGYPFQIAKCYEALDEKELALDYFIQSAEIRKDDPAFGLDNERTKESIQNVLRIAIEMERMEFVPDWIKNIEL